MGLFVSRGVGVYSCFWYASSSRACALAGLRAPVARDALASGYSFSRIVVGVLRLPFDNDDDGYSSVLGGGDCNDDDAEINPGQKSMATQSTKTVMGAPPRCRKLPSLRFSLSLRLALGFRTPYSIIIVS